MTKFYCLTSKQLVKCSKRECIHNSQFSLNQILISNNYVATNAKTNVNKTLSFNKQRLSNKLYNLDNLDSENPHLRLIDKFNQEKCKVFPTLPQFYFELHLTKENKYLYRDCFQYLENLNPSLNNDLKKHKTKLNPLTTRCIQDLLKSYINQVRSGQYPKEFSFEQWIESSSNWISGKTIQELKEQHPVWDNANFHNWWWNELVLPQINKNHFSHKEINLSNLEIIDKKILISTYIKSFKYFMKEYYVNDKKFFSFYDGSFIQFIKSLVYNHNISEQEILKIIHEFNLWNSLTLNDYKIFSKIIINFLEKIFNIEDLNNKEKINFWHNITKEDLIKIFKSKNHILIQNSFRNNLLDSLYDNYLVNLNENNNELITKSFKRNKLIRYLKYILSDVDIFENYTFRIDSIEYGISSIHVHVFIPKFNVAIHYLGEQYYMDIPSFPHVASYWNYIKILKDYLSKENITLLTIPYWWDTSLEQLKGTLSKQKEFKNILQSNISESIYIPEIYNHMPKQNSTSLIWDMNSSIEGFYYRPTLKGISCILTIKFIENEINISIKTRKSGKIIPFPIDIKNELNLIAKYLGPCEIKGILYSLSNYRISDLLGGKNISSMITTNSIWNDIKFQIGTIVYQNSDKINRIEQTLKTEEKINFNSFLQPSEWRFIQDQKSFLNKFQNESKINNITYTIVNDNFNSNVEIEVKHIFYESMIFLKKIVKSNKYLLETKDGIRVTAMALPDFINENLQPNISIVKVVYTDKYPTTKIPIRSTIISIEPNSSFPIKNSLNLDSSNFINNLNNLLKEGYSIETVEEKISIISEVIKKTNILYPTQFEKNYISDLFQINHETLSRIMIQARELQRFPGMMQNVLRKDKLNYVKEWIISHSDKIDQNAIIDLQNTTGLSKKTIRNIIRYNKEIKGELSEEKKLIIFEFLKGINFAQPTSNDLTKLQEKTSLSRSQLYKQISIILNRSDILIEREHNEKIKNWLIANNFRSPTKDEYLELQNQTKLGKQQLYSIVSRLKDIDGILTEKKINIIKKSLDQGDSLENIVNKLHSELQLSRKQIYYVLNNIKNKSGKITQEKRDYIINVWNKYIEESNSKKYSIPKNLINQLQSQLELSANQIRSIIKSIAEKRGRVTIEKKEYIEEWLINHSSDEVDWKHLEKKTLLNRNQLHRIVSSIRDQRGVLTNDKKIFLQNWLKENTFQNPNKQQLIFLQEKLLLSRSQIQEFIRYALDPPITLTEDIKLTIQNIFNGNSKLSEEIIREAQSKTKISRRQIQYLWRKYSQKKNC